MRDLDKIQEHEFRQQELIEGIVRSLHEWSRDSGDYRRQFLEICQQLLVDLHEQLYCKNGTLTENPTRKLAWKFVSMPICTFTNVQEERLYLLTRAFEKIFASVSSGTAGAYNYKMILESTPNLA